MTKLKNSICGKTSKLKNSIYGQIETKHNQECDKTKQLKPCQLRNSNFDKTETKLDCNKTEELWLWQNSKSITLCLLYFSLLFKMTTTFIFKLNKQSCLYPIYILQIIFFFFTLTVFTVHGYTWLWDRKLEANFNTLTVYTFIRVI